MANQDALSIYLADGWSLIAANIKSERDGNLTADLLLQNGTIQHADRGVINTTDGRAAWARAATGPNRPSEVELANALLALLPDALAQVQEAGRRESQADQLVSLIVEAAKDFTTDVLESIQLFHTPDSEAYATNTINHRRETWPIRSRPFKRWLSRRFYEQYQKTPNSQALQDAIGVLEGKALFDGPEHQVYTRIARVKNRIYVDLVNDAWQAVEIDVHGWRILDTPPVKFRRAKGMLALPIPIDDGNIGALRASINVASDAELALVLGWLVAAYRPEGPYPVLAIHGEQGSAKSTTARVLRALVDPNTAPLRAEPRDGRDLVIAARNGWALAYDNLSHIPPWLSDALCRLSTGGGFSTRQLYSDDDEIIFDACRPVILTGITELATRSDLLDRTIIINLPSIDEEDRRPEADFWAAFDEVAPSILGALLTAVSVALKQLPATKLDRLPRLADVALWVTAAEPALGLEDGAFVEAYDANRADANDLALEASPVAAELLKLIEINGDWEGEPTQLLAALESQISDSTKRLRAWPKSARTLSGILKRLAPNLRKKGVAVAFGKTDGSNSRRWITVRKLYKPSD